MRRALTITVLLALGCGLERADVERRATPLLGAGEVTVGPEARFADVDGDGALDVFTASGLQRLVGEELWLTARLPFGWRTPALADIDGDGDLDVVFRERVSGRDVPRVALAAEEGWTVRETGVDPVGIAPARGDVWADVDGDGDHDYLRSGSSTLDVYLAEGGVLSETPAAALDAYWPVVVADLDGDGALDLASATPTRGYFATWRGAGDGTFTAAEGVQLTPAVQLRAFDLGDVDGDGQLEAVVSAYQFGAPSIGRTYVLDRAPDGAWTQRPDVGNAGDVSGDARLFDFDRDGDLDYVVRSLAASTQGVLVQINDGAGAFVDRVRLVDAPLGQVADLDGDGAPDLTVGSVTGFVPVGPSAPDATWDLPSTADAVAFADVEGATLVALVADGQPVRVARVLEGGGVQVEQVDAEPMAARAVAFGDLDGDGDLDLAVAVEGAPDRLYRNDAGAWARLDELGGAARTRAVALADYDLDGDVDLALGAVIGPTRVYENRAGVLTERWSTEDELNTEALAWFDYDGDGDLDLTEGLNGFNRIFRNVDGDFELGWTAPVADLTLTVAWTDLEQDGAPELVVGNVGPDRIWSFGLEVEARPLDGDEPTRAVGAVDVDGDGDLDLVRSTESGLRVARTVGGAPVADPTIDDLPGAALGWTRRPDGALWLATTATTAGLRAYRARWATDALALGTAPPPRVRLLDVPEEANLARAGRVGPRLRYEVEHPEPASVQVELRYGTGNRWRDASIGAPVEVSSSEGRAVYEVIWRVSEDLDGAAAVRLRLLPKAPVPAPSRALAGPRGYISAPLVIGAPSACADAEGRPRAAGTLCRRAQGPCDVEERCDGASLECPVDALADASVVCREAADGCDVPELCDGASPACPADAFAEDGASCSEDACAPAACGAGLCVARPAPVCDDEDVCTADACDAELGCTHARIEGCCLADFECTGAADGQCIDNVCVYPGAAPTPPEEGGGCTSLGGARSAAATWTLALALVFGVARRRSRRSAR